MRALLLTVLAARLRLSHAVYFFCDGVGCHEPPVSGQDRDGKQVFLDVYFASDEIKANSSDVRSALTRSMMTAAVDKWLDDALPVFASAVGNITGSKPRWFLDWRIDPRYEQRLGQTVLQKALQQEAAARLKKAQLEAELKSFEAELIRTTTVANVSGNESLLEEAQDVFSQRNATLHPELMNATTKYDLAACLISDMKKAMADMNLSQPSCDPDWTCSSNTRPLALGKTHADVSIEFPQMLFADEECHKKPRTNYSVGSGCYNYRWTPRIFPAQNWCPQTIEANLCFLATRSMDCFCEALALHSTTCCREPKHSEADPFVSLACGREPCCSPAPVFCDAAQRQKTPLCQDNETAAAGSTSEPVSATTADASHANAADMASTVMLALGLSWHAAFNHL
eukprot:TRINITY_DN34377_c0_g1_i1.p1 TRINITY_DN34377_c0_g1~~TRINITY_DN34377_c0_g1_i1.p1  ORF type:complete len:398 (+),score=42.40 TRINITY_DN34377_c0_g1_i1:114-1307(+)